MKLPIRSRLVRRPKKSVNPVGDIVLGMINAFHQSAVELRARISNVNPAGFEEFKDELAAVLTFDFIEKDGLNSKYKGYLVGPNRDYVLGFGAELDISLAYKTFMSGDIVKI
ncbi:MAG: hypothetical protein ABW007_19420 [Chitinophagaceae bacterium]